MNLLELSKQDRKEISFIEVAKHIFLENREPISFKDLVDQIAEFLELSTEEVRPRMVQFYTDLNIDGRFISLGENRWGLREWYPIDQIDEEIIIPTKPKKKKKKKVKEEDLIDEFDDYEDLDEEELDEEDLDEEDEEEDESLEALREEEEEEFNEEDLVDEVDYEIDEDEELEIDEEDLDDDLDEDDDEYVDEDEE